MRIRRVSIKDYLVRVQKKGKTRGRPSKEELVASYMVSNEMKKNRKEIQKVINDCLIYGTGICEVKS